MPANAACLRKGVSESAHYPIWNHTRDLIQCADERIYGQKRENKRLLVEQTQASGLEEPRPAAHHGALDKPVGTLIQNHDWAARLVLFR